MYILQNHLAGFLKNTRVTKYKTPIFGSFLVVFGNLNSLMYKRSLLPFQDDNAFWNWINSKKMANFLILYLCKFHWKICYDVSLQKVLKIQNAYFEMFKNKTY